MGDGDVMGMVCCVALGLLGQSGRLTTTIPMAILIPIPIYGAGWALGKGIDLQVFFVATGAFSKGRLTHADTDDQAGILEASSLVQADCRGAVIGYCAAELCG